MQKFTSSIIRYASMIDADKLRLLVLVASLVMFVLAAGAPAADGGIGR
jgi:hypothetical protein